MKEYTTEDWEGLADTPQEFDEAIKSDTTPTTIIDKIHSIFKLKSPFVPILETKRPLAMFVFFRIFALNLKT